jgi:hypothetical protein
MHKCENGIYYTNTNEIKKKEMKEHDSYYEIDGDSLQRLFCQFAFISHWRCIRLVCRRWHNVGKRRDSFVHAKIRNRLELQALSSFANIATVHVDMLDDDHEWQPVDVELQDLRGLFAEVTRLKHLRRIDIRRKTNLFVDTRRSRNMLSSYTWQPPQPEQ